MAEEKFKVTIKGPGLDFNQSVERVDATLIMSFVMTGSALPSQGQSTGGGSGAGGGALPAGNGASNFAGMNPKQFIATKRPNTQYERIACFAYFLANARNVYEFGADEIVAINKEAAQQPILNIGQIINDTARKYKYLSSAGDRNKQITALGDAVVEALPDREAVKAALAEHRPGKKRKKRATKKKSVK